MRLEFTTQIDGESFWVEYDDFKMSKGEFDDITYNPSEAYPKINQYEAYPITNLGKMTSSLKNGSFIFILPAFHEEGLKRERQKLKLYHDNLYLGFTALDNVTNYQCSREYNSGWWYPHALRAIYDSGWPVKESCTHHPLNGTNLNGVFNDLNPNQTTRTIGFCSMNDVKECIKPKKDGWVIIGWESSNTKTLKLRSTKMWLGRKT